MALAWDPAQPIQVTAHLVRRWRQRIRRGDSAETITRTVVDYLRAQPAGAGRIREGADGNPAIYFRWRPDHRGPHPGWQIKVSPALGDGWVVHTVVRVHGTVGNRAEARRRDRRAWLLWVEWCATNGRSPVDLASLPDLAAELDGHVTNQHRNLGRTVRGRVADILGGTYEATLDEVPRIIVRSATGRQVHW